MTEIRKGQIRRVKSPGVYPSETRNWTVVHPGVTGGHWYKTGYELGVLDVTEQDIFVWIIDTNKIISLTRYPSDKEDVWINYCTEVVDEE